MKKKMKLYGMGSYALRTRKENLWYQKRMGKSIVTLCNGWMNGWIVWRRSEWSHICCICKLSLKTTKPHKKCKIDCCFVHLSGIIVLVLCCLTRDQTNSVRVPFITCEIYKKYSNITYHLFSRKASRVEQFEQDHT